ncbi:acyltransferase family protein [Methanosarcina sp. 2.H.A.1B.4]|uniref:acyltransferase family protein n=1 Tax=Methanosarcina sp. 2.H.A.1B.4 TaxID=1483600 RepID=UPI0006216A1D|nr:acyltransferase family protein [Methanosarcina sp. 2.H.A.1B.4]KKG10247.1 acetyltransferase [Methanosarcina sp. 2.H.A.1B.4]
MRLHWIDALKGIGIMLVVFAHHSLPVALDTYIFSFHMPLFFFISGLLFDFEKYAGSAANFVKGRFRSLIVPYFSFALLTGLFYFLLDTGFQPGVTNIEFFENSTLYGIYSILYALGPLVSYNPPLWFLSCLFVTEILFYGFAKKYYGKPRKLVLWLIAAGIVGYLYAVYAPSRLFWNADVALSAVVFYGAGNLFKKITEPEKESGSGSSLNSGSGLSAGLSQNADSSLNSSSSLNSGSGFREKFVRAEKFFPVVFILLNLLYLGYLLEFPTTDKVNMNVLKYGGFFSYYLLAFSGIFAFVYLFKKVGSSRILEYYGRNSLIVLALHFPLKDILTKLALLSFGVELEYFYYNVAFALSLTVLNLICLVPVIFIINNYFPFLIGKKRSSKALKAS